MSSPSHPEFNKALAAGLICPALLPDGSALIIDGFEFYEAVGGLSNMCLGRLMQFTDVMERHDRLKLDETTLRAYFTSVSELALLALQKLESEPETAVQSLSDIAQLSRNGRHRLDLCEDVIPALNVGANAARLYETASVWFFTPDEDPAVYDSDKGKRNLKLLLSRPELYDFFLRLRLIRYVPLGSLSDENTLSAIRQLQEMDLETLLLFTQTRLMLETNGKKSTSIQYLSSLTETLRGYDSSYEALYQHLTSTWPPGSAIASEPPPPPPAQPSNEPPID